MTTRRVGDDPVEPTGPVAGDDGRLPVAVAGDDGRLPVAVAGDDGRLPVATRAAARTAVPSPVVRAGDLGLRTRQGWVFRGVDLAVLPGELVALTGPARSGRTSLLLALAGRFVTNHGTLTLAGPAALGYVPDVSEPEPGLTVAEHVEERLLLLGRAGWRRSARRRVVAGCLADYPGDADRLIRNLDTFHLHLLGLVLARLEQPRLVVVDDADADLSTAERAALWARLRGLADEGMAVIAACRECVAGAHGAGPTPDRVFTLEENR